MEHVVVLMLENRSFDHMLGYLRHPSAEFDGLLGGGPYSSPGWEGGPAVAAAPGAGPLTVEDPDHSHDAAVEQFHGAGFVSSLERKGRGLAQPRFGGLLGPVIEWFYLRFAARDGVPGLGPEVMRCQDPAEVPVLATLATSFAVCTRWFCSVPGETWPNRNFVHAASSDGETSIHPRLYANRTIFEVLEEAGHRWHVYHDDVPQVWAFPALWNTEGRLAGWYDISDFSQHVMNGELPAYSFIEPNHRPPIRLNDRPSNSQHPGNNLVRDQAPGESTDFARAEELIASVYEALRGNPAVFAKTVLVVTYDEHGGLYDHVMPMTGLADPGPARGFFARFFHWLAHKRSADFDFSWSGGRVPAVVISPLIPAATVCATPLEHASVPATLRALFTPSAPPLTARDRDAARFDDLCTLPAPRTDLPDLSAYVGVRQAAARAEDAPAPQADRLPPHCRELAVLARRVRARLRGRPAILPRVSWPARDRRAVAQALPEFRAAAENARNSPG
ncbi:alkaline phosphatase family protein [Nonomuraea sp. NBC_01738]|uniref:alkaline phosphatase family protein n=1 Tax=Nonomuraea sp. NBC_01738 TaxID=2976003 RepID=UPI002E10652A|nr:alkaline phosphatase family protein [Nonomuraea sp. NBC_01738]